MTEGENVEIPGAIKVLRDRIQYQNGEIVASNVEHPNLLPLLAVSMTSEMASLVTQLMPLGCFLDYVRNDRDRIRSKSRRSIGEPKSLAAGQTRFGHPQRSPQRLRSKSFGLAKLLHINEDEYKSV